MSSKYHLKNLPVIRLAALAILLFMAGCAQTYHLRVDALKDPGFDSIDAGVTTYFLERFRERDAPQDLRFQEAARLMEHTLTSKGLQRVHNRDQADLLIGFETSISSPTTATETHSEPVYYRSRGYYSSIRTPVYGADGKVVSFVNTRVYMPPQTEMAGFRDRSRHVTVYEKKLLISAWNYVDGARQDELWTVSVAARDQESNLRGYLPYLLSAALPYIGERTDGEVYISLKENDDSVEWVRSGLR